MAWVIKKLIFSFVPHMLNDIEIPRIYRSFNSNTVEVLLTRRTPYSLTINEQVSYTI